ncbi:MAG: hypothetical protein EB165_07110, partial [Euryarchaeota archaeon]|nr:hypothetical protein [Euryarchaeota archaeon]NDB94388.1 hypothetical protein [Euryarchaeota archaeon]
MVRQLILILALLIPNMVIADASRKAASIEEATTLTDCASPRINPPKDSIWNHRSARCGETGWLYWFYTKEANEGHGQLCRTFGGNPVDSGANWTLYDPG